MAGDEQNPASPVRIAAVGDIHCKRRPGEGLRLLLEQAAEEAELLLLCGDLTDRGLPVEAEVLAQEIARLRIATVAVLGNHDYESGHAHEVVNILRQAGAIMLDGESYEYNDDIGVVGTKGFGGGFGSSMLQAWGERAIKDFVYESIREELKLESSLAKLDSPTKLVLLHYSPIRATCEGENPEIMPFLGSTRLESPLEKFGATIVFHGHAHHGHRRATTRQGVPVHNVSLPVIRQHGTGRPYLLLEVGPEGGTEVP